MSKKKSSKPKEVVEESPKTETEPAVEPQPEPQQPKKKSKKSSALEVGKHYIFGRAAIAEKDRQGEVPASSWIGKVVAIAAESESVGIKLLTQGTYSDARSYDLAGLIAEEVTGEVAYNLSINPKHYG